MSRANRLMVLLAGMDLAGLEARYMEPAVRAVCEPPVVPKLEGIEPRTKRPKLKVKKRTPDPWERPTR